MSERSFQAAIRQSEGSVNIQHVIDLQSRRRRTMPMLAVVAVTYNSADVLPGLLNSLNDGLHGVERSRVIIVDNDSHDESVDIARLHPLKPEIILTGRNAGYAAGINAAAATLPCDADMLVLNPDIRLHHGMARVLLESLRRPGVGVVVPRILHEDGTTARSLRREPSILTVWSETILGGAISSRIGTGEIIGNDARYRQSGPVQWATGAALMIAANARQRVGEWDESFFLYSEEVDYMRRVRQCGFSVEYVREAEATHIGGDYQSSPFLSGLMTTNKIRDFGRRHGKLQLALFRLGVAAGSAVRYPIGPAHRASLRAALTAPRT
jgi:N-acetylglucosaminyl-diphospho-decaprenol L-rhamnosyltransferase